MKCTRSDAMLVRIPALLLLSSALASAQFDSLAPTGDGSRVYFATSLRQKNTTEPAHGKLFRFDTRLALHESRTEIPPRPLSGQNPTEYQLSNIFNLEGVSVSSDGSAVAAIASRYCIGDTILCAKQQHLAFTTITIGGQSNEYQGRLQLSANGRWAFGNAARFSGLSSYADMRLVDTRTGVVVTYFQDFSQPALASSGRTVANDGTGVYTDQSRVVLLRGGRVYRRITPENGDQASEAVIDAEGRSVVYSVYRRTCPETNGCDRIDPPRAIYIASTSIDSEPRLLTEGYAPAISDAGLSILYLRRAGGIPQAWLINADGTGARQVTNDPAGISRATISGNGQTAYAVTFGGRLIKIALFTGEVTELIPRTPWLDLYQRSGAAPGKFTMFTGAGFAASDNSQVTIQGRRAIVAGVDLDAISVLVPDDVAVTRTPQLLAISAAPGSPFDGPRTMVPIEELAPEALYSIPRRGDTPLLAVHQDWSALVTRENPARPGEIIHAYAVGLGPTLPAVAYGRPAPSVEPLARLRNQYTCSYYATTSQEVRILYQGLAPGLAGIYQLDMEVPADAARDISITCEGGGLSSRRFYGRIPVAP